MPAAWWREAGDLSSAKVKGDLPALPGSLPEFYSSGNISVLDRRALDIVKSPALPTDADA